MGKTKKSRNGIGTLELRANTWLARWVVNGKRYTRSTGCAKKDKDLALEKLKEYTSDFVLRDNKRALENIEARIRSVDRSIEIADEGKESLNFAYAWSVYLKSQSRPRSGAGTLRNYEQQYFIFVDWLKLSHPELTELRQITPAIANEYAQALLEGTPAETRDLIKKAKDDLSRYLLIDPLKRSELMKEEIEKCKKLIETPIREPVRGSTFNRHLNALALIWRHCAADESSRIKGNPWAWDKNTGKGIRRIKLNHAERPRARRTLLPEEIFKLLSKAEGEMRVLIAIGFYTGLRLGDAVLLSWENIDRTTGKLNVRSRKTDTETATRVHPSLARIIEDNVKTESGYLMPDLAATYKDGISGRCRLNDKLLALFKSVGIKTSVKDEGDARAHSVCGFHSLRHTFVTALRDRGASLTIAKELAGHNTTAMTEHYTHENDRAVLALPDVTNEAGEIIECTPTEIDDTSKNPERIIELIKQCWRKLDKSGRTEFAASINRIISK